MTFSSKATHRLAALTTCLVSLTTSCKATNEHLETNADQIYLMSVAEDATAPHRRPGVRELVDSKDVVMIAIIPESCGASGFLDEGVERAREAFIGADDAMFMVVNDAYLDGLDQDEELELHHWMRKTFGRLFYPTVALFEGGELVDFFQGATGGEGSTSMLHMMYRNGIIPDSPGYAYDTRTMTASERESFQARIQSVTFMDAYDFSRQDFSGYDFSDGVLSGSNFSGANLTDANFNHSVLFRANFCGANTTRASFEGARFRNTICPDGSRSDEHNGICKSSNINSITPNCPPPDP